MSTTTIYNLTNSGIINSQKKTFTAPAGGDQNIVFDGSLVGAGKSNVFLVNIVPSGAYIYRYHATNPTSDWITTGTSVVLSSTTAIGTYLTGFTSGVTYTVSVTVLG